MKFNCGPSSQERFASKQLWHKHFAILPERVGPNQCVWLEYVERRVYYDNVYIRPLGSTDTDDYANPRNVYHLPEVVLHSLQYLLGLGILLSSVLAVMYAVALFLTKLGI